MRFVYWYLIIVLLFLFNSDTRLNAQSNFNVIFAADPEIAGNTNWLQRIAEDWGATGICIRLTWVSVDNNSIPGADTWKHLGNAINTITGNKYGGKNLDIYLRVSMGLGKPVWVKPGSYGFTDDDFQINHSGEKYDHRTVEGEVIPEIARYPLNFSSPRSSERMKEFLNSVLDHINTYPSGKKNRIKEVIPTFTPTDEQEYPIGTMCGYSSYEIKLFQNFLLKKYFTIDNLNKKWNTDFRTFDKINPIDYNWWKITPFTKYELPKGRIDWMNFRTEQLANFINSLAQICQNDGYKSGLQVGSLYDSYIEFRGWADPTMLLEKVNSVHTADLSHYSENFDFAANFTKSLCKFWSKYRNENLYFTTETNWPGYDNQSPAVLTEKWKEQLENYYNYGASAIYLIDWSVTVEQLNKLGNEYKEWRELLLRYSNRPIIKQNNSNEAIHLACEKVLYTNHNIKLSNSRFVFYDSLALQSSYLAKPIKQDNTKDIITNYMIEKDPSYLQNYNRIYMTKTSRYITEEADEVLKKSAINVIK